MKILWVKAGGLIPFDSGGKIRSFQILKHLARKHDVTFYSFYRRHADDAHADLQGTFARVVTTPLALPEPRSFAEYAKYARLLLTGRSATMEKYYHRDVQRTLSALAAATRFDVIVCDFVCPAGMIDWTLPCPKILFTHNVEAQIWDRQARVTRNPVRRLACRLEYGALTRAEERYAKLADCVLAVSENDRAFFARHVPPERTAVIPTGVDVDYFQPGGEAEEPASMVFTGSMDWLPNEDAVHHFAADILPLIRRDVPAAHFLAVGRRPSPALRALASESVRITGTVPDIRPYLDRAAVCVVPLRSGSGTRIKIFEAMAMGKAVVSTTVGAEGLPVTHGENIMLADAPEDLARTAVRLLRDPDLRARLGRAARTLVERDYSWAAAAERFHSVMCSVVDDDGARS
jgi:sugar transferase (PEP-CTERM/EpsH1 system associated)